MRSCLAAVKGSMLVIQRAPETISAALQAEPSSCKLEEMLSDLLNCYIHILTDGDCEHGNEHVNLFFHCSNNIVADYL